jgi:hypothetical protein
MTGTARSQTPRLDSYADIRAEAVRRSRESLRGTPVMTRAVEVAVDETLKLALEVFTAEMEANYGETAEQLLELGHLLNKPIPEAELNEVAIREWLKLPWSKERAPEAWAAWREKYPELNEDDPQSPKATDA